MNDSVVYGMAVAIFGNDSVTIDDEGIDINYKDLVVHVDVVDGYAQGTATYQPMNLISNLESAHIEAHEVFKRLKGLVD